MATASGDGAELPDDAGCRVYVGNLTPKAGEAHLQAQFARFGVIHSIWVARKVRTRMCSSLIAAMQWR